MQSQLSVVMAQINPVLGDIPGNTQLIIDTAKKACRQFSADLVVFPELSLTGYPPEDLLLRPALLERVNKALAEITRSLKDSAAVIIGHPRKEGNQLRNSASVISKGKTLLCYDKQHLPNYGVFDELRYFTPGTDSAILELNGFRLALGICEDFWQAGPLANAAKLGCDVAVCLNASPFHQGKFEQRLAMLREQQRNDAAIGIIYVNCFGGQDELVFDGNSVVLDSKGAITHQANAFASDLVLVSITKPANGSIIIKPGQQQKLGSEISSIYQALVLGTRDYLNKSGFPGALVGLSGGIDSALTLCVAVDAIGADRVEAVLMPSRYTASMSNQDALALCQSLGVKALTLPIEPCFDTFLQTLAKPFANSAVDSSEQNIQARIRGTLLMALSNKFGKLVLTTGNKSEMAVGYATLYGDMAGGFAVLKDVKKTLVYELARAINSDKEIIPSRIIERAPSAELAEEQLDSDSLPPYPLLDEILSRYVEHNQSIEQMVADGLEQTVVEDVVSLIDKNEYKRRQAPPGIKISPRAFGRDWRYPITSGYQKHLHQRKSKS